MEHSAGLRKIARLNCAGGGQVVVDRQFAYIGHMDPGVGTSIADVSDPLAPRIVAQVPVAAGFHSHKVRASNGLMLVNRELVNKAAAQAAVRGGLGIYDISKPAQPREITHWSCGGRGVHRFTFDGRYAYLSPELDGYLGNIMMILDLIDPAHRREIGRWWLPRQWIAGGETPSWNGRAIVYFTHPTQGLVGRFDTPSHGPIGCGWTYCRLGSDAMSRSEVERFAADLKSNAALRAEAEKNEAAQQHVPRLARATAFAASKGYKFTVDHAKEHVKARAKAAGRELTDAELDGVAGAAVICGASGLWPDAAGARR